MTWFQCRDRICLRFRGGFENDLVLVYGSKFTWCVPRGIEIT